MANPHKGEASLTVGEAQYTLVFDINGLCEVESLLGLSINQILGRMESLTVVRALVWGGLRAKHPEITLNEAGAMVEAIGGAGAALEAVGRGLAGAMPDPKEGVGSRPRKGAGAGTGRRSRKRGSKPA
jgi:hypothetical protein